MNVPLRIEEARSRATEWLVNMQAPAAPTGVLRSSRAHDVTAYPGMRLPATYNAWHALALMQTEMPSTDAKEGAIAFINSFQGDDGLYRIPEMRDADVYKHDDLAYTWEYIHFHVTNYALGAIDALGGTPARPLAFLSEYATPDRFRRWTTRRHWDDPWLEGNSVVNLAAFYDYAAHTARFDDLLEYLDALQDPETGYWGEDCASTPTKMLHAMAGATHDYHLYFRRRRFPPRTTEIIDATLTVATGQLEGVSSACLDIDIVDILANLGEVGYRRREIHDYLDRKLTALLHFQGSDGGFRDETDGIRTFDGWPRGYHEPQGISNCFATWFRMATIGMIEWALYPEARAGWTFRNTLGMGYFAPPERNDAQ